MEVVVRNIDDLIFDGQNKTGLSTDEAVSLLAKPKELDYKHNEKAFEKIVCDQLPDIMKRLGRSAPKEIMPQLRIKANRHIGHADIYVVHEDNTTSIIEVKNSGYSAAKTGEHCRAIGQLLYYAKMFEISKGVFPELYLIDSKISPQLMFTFSGMKIPVTVIEMQDNKCVAINLKTV